MCPVSIWSEIICFVFLLEFFYLAKTDVCVIFERRRPSYQGALTDPCTKLNNFLNFLVDQTVWKKKKHLQ